MITSDRDLWAETMMCEELGFGSTEPNEYRAALSTLVAFLTIGFLPLLVPGAWLIPSSGARC